tara:strand:+ start:3674 stop:3814 length:141 start_codon:yes stop_codon:yes gene_type:complete
LNIAKVKYELYSTFLKDIPSEIDKLANQKNMPTNYLILNTFTINQQ